MMSFCKILVPQDFSDSLESIRDNDNDNAMKAFGIDTTCFSCTDTMPIMIHGVA